MREKRAAGAFQRCFIVMMFVFLVYTVFAAVPVLASEETPVVQYVYIESPEVAVGEAQNIILGFDKDMSAYQNVILHYTSEGEAREVGLAQVIEKDMLFTIAKAEEGTNELISVEIKDIGLSIAMDGTIYFSGVDLNGTNLQMQDIGNMVSDGTENIGEALEGANVVSGDSNGASTFSEEQKNLVVVLDPGHGGTAPGAVYSGYEEKDLNWKIAVAAKAELEKYNNVTVYLTRAEDETITNTPRAEYASSVNADVFVSIHNNSSVNHDAQGAEVWVTRHSDYTEEATGLGQEILDNLIDKFGLQDREVKTRVCTDEATYDNGQLEDYYTVISACAKRGIPAMIVEHAFMDNEADLDILINNLDAIGQSDAQAIANYYGLTKKEAVIKIVSTTDIHARVDENVKSGYIGVAKLKTIADTYLENADIRLMLDSGDFFHGQSIATLSAGESMAQLAAVLGYDALTCGNHDWNYGSERLLELEKIVGENTSAQSFSILAGNVRKTSDGSQFFPNEYLIKEQEVYGTNVKVGVFGVIDPAIYSSTAPANVEGLEFTDMQDYANQAVSDLKEQGCQVIIGMAHTLYPEEIAAKIDGVNLWLSGHGHLNINTEVTTPNGQSVTVMENGYYLTQVGEIEIRLDPYTETVNSVQAVGLNYSTSDAQNLSENETVAAKLAEIKAEQEEIANQVVGQCPQELPYSWETIRTKEQLIGRLATSAYLSETNADVAIENAGGIRAGLPQGDVTKANLISVFPFGNYIVTKEIQGSELIKVLEKSIQLEIDNNAAYKKQLENPDIQEDIWPEDSGSYLQVGGVTVYYDTAAEEGNRILLAKVGEENLDSEKYYTVAMNNYLATSSKYSELAAQPIVNEYSACDEAMIRYLALGEEVITESLNKASMIEGQPEPTVTVTPTPTPTETPTVTPTPTVQPSTTPRPTVTATPTPTSTNSSNKTNTSSPKTGDEQPLAGYLALICVSVLIFAGTSYKKKKVK